MPWNVHGATYFLLSLTSMSFFVILVFINDKLVCPEDFPEPIPGILGMRWEYTLNWMAIVSVVF